MSDRGRVLSAAVGFAPTSQLEVRLNVESNRLTYHLEPASGRFRGGGGLVFVSGELQFAMRGGNRVSPFALAGVGGGVKHPAVDVSYGSSGVFVAYVGGGVRVPLRPAVSVIGDARVVRDVKNKRGVATVWPIRLGLTWRF